MRRSPLWLVLLLLLLTLVAPVAYGAITSAGISPASLNAGASSDVTVTFTAAADVEVGGSVLVRFPAGFRFPSSPTATVRTTGSTTTLSATLVSSTQISVQVGVTKISAGQPFTFSIAGVTNPGEQTTGTFAITTYDSSNTIIETNAAVSGVVIASTTLSGASVTPDSLNAGVVGTVTVSFTSNVGLPVGSMVKVTFPSDFTVASTTLSSAINISSSSTVATSNSVVTVTVASSAVATGVSVSFKLDGVTNPGAKTTGTFALATTDSSSNVLQQASAISAVTTTSTVLTGASVTVDNNLAGVDSLYRVGFTINVAVPVGGYVVLGVPNDYSLSGNIILVDSVLSSTWEGTINGQAIQFVASSSYAAGSHTIQVKFLQNPGASTTGSFTMSTTDANGFLLESAHCGGVTIVPGSITNAVLTPQFAHPGIVSRVDISFTTAAGLATNSLIIIQLPSGDYEATVATLSVAVASPSSSSAAASWNSTTSDLLVLITSSTTIPHGIAVTLQVTALEMPPSIRASSTAATIESWNAKGLKLDEQSTLTLSAITAVEGLSCTWSTETPNPGIISDVLVTFNTSGMIPVGGKIALTIPASDFYADSTGNVPAVVFTVPNTVAATATWDTATSTLDLVIANVSIPAYTTGGQVKIMKLDTPVSVRPSGRLPAMLSTFDSLGVEIDGPSALELDAITSGFILGSRLWTAVNPVAGVSSSQTIDFFITGRMDPGGKFEFTLPDTQWTMAASGSATFTSPNLGSVGSVVWDAPTRMMTVTLTGTTSIPSYTGVILVIQDVTNPPKETGINNAYLTTRAADDSIIDGPDTISVMTISRGTLAGAKSWQSVTTTSASMQSDQMLSFSLNGALPSGSIIVLALPPGGWRMANSASVSVSFSLPATSVAVQSVDWSSTTFELRIVTAGNLSEGTAVELLVKDMINPYSSSPAGTCSVVTMLADSGVVAESQDINVNTITSDPLPTNATWTSTIPTPGVLSTQTITFTTGGELEAGATFCVTIQDEWTPMASASASLTLAGTSQSTPLALSFNTTTNTLCMQTAVEIDQGKGVIIVLTDILSPESIRPERVAQLLILSHLGGGVNTGSILVNAVTAGALTGPLTWQTQVLSPGPVAGLKTSANLAFKTTGQIAAGGHILVELPFVWVIASTCEASFITPPVLGTVSCSQNNISILLLDGLDEATDVNIYFVGVYNPPLVLPEGVASAQTLAPDGGEIDESNTIVTGAITSAVAGITNAGDHLVAVVGVAKTFAFQGSALAEGDVVKFVDASTTSDANCGVSTTGQSDAGGVGVEYLSANLDISVKFTQSSPDHQPFAICYKFGDNPFKLYTAISITVKGIESVSSDVGFSDIAVANFVKTWSFGGNGIAVGDQVRWIELDIAQSATYISTPPDCLNTTTLAKLAPPVSGAFLAQEDDYTRVVQTNATASFAFSVETSGKTFCLCYKFGNEPFTIYPSIIVQVNDLQAIAVESPGADGVAVVDAPKSFKFVGDGVFLNDRLYFVELGSVASCDESNSDTLLRLMHMVNGQEQSVLFIDASLVTTVNFDATAAGMIVIPCYQFGMEPYQLYQNIRLTVNMVQQYTGTLGSPELAVAEVAEPLTFLGYGLSGGDQVRWILHGQEDCESSLASLIDPGTLGVVDTITLDQNSAGLFNFTTTQDDFNPLLCYKFGDENFKLYTGISIAIGTLQGKSSILGAKDITVAESRKNFTLLGTNLAEGDRVGWTTAIDSDFPCNNLSLLIVNPLNTDSDSLSYVTSDNTFGVELSPLSSGERVNLCYGFGREPLKLFAELYLDVKSITNMRALVASPTIAVAGAIKTFLFDGDGVATGDFAKFVSSNSSDCTYPGVTLMNIIKEYDDYNEMAMYLYEISNSTTTTGDFQVSADPKSAGLNRVLCYRFGEEPFVYYENFHIDVKTIWGLQQADKTAGGQDNVAVVNEPKLMTIDGVGMGEKDTLKFVNASSDSQDADCSDLPAQGQISQHLQVASDLTVSLPFDFGSNGGMWTLCYKFDDEPFRLYTSVTITVKEITALLDYTFQDIAGLGSVATIGHQKQWKPVGSGIQEGDTVKIVPQSVAVSADCGENDANIATGTSLMTVGSTLIFSGVITAFPSSTSDVYHLCYQFQGEPFTYIRGFMLTTYGITGLDRTIVLATASTTVQISGFRISDTDEMGWTTSTTNCTTMLGRTPVSGTKVNVGFPLIYSQLFMCYSFNRQPFDIFKTVTLAVVKAEIWTPQTVSIIADQSTEIDVSGTFGIAQGTDQIAWIPSDAVDCSTTTISMYTQIMITSVVSATKSQSIIPNAGAGVLTAKYVAPGSGSGITATSSFSTWKLCYRFGTTASYLMFGNVLCMVLNVVQVLLVDLQSASTGAVMRFEFNGIGIQDFDAAKWVDASAASSDADCSSLPAIGGSKTTDVINSRATFTFVQDSSSMALCYKFIGHAFKLYANIPIQDSTASGGQSTSDAITTSYDEEAAAAASDQFTPSRDVATASLSLDKDIGTIPGGSSAEAAFKVSFVASLATSLGIDASRIQIIGIVAGSVVVNFQLLPSDSTADPTVNELIQDLQDQLMDANSALLTSNAVVVKNAAAALSFTMSTLPALSTSSVAIQALGYQPNGLFSFVRTIYSVTEKSSKLVIPIIRLQGTTSILSVAVQIQAVGTTAIFATDYDFSASTTFDATLNVLHLRFDIGVVLQTIELDILDNDIKGPHFKSLSLALLDPQTVGAALGITKKTTVRIYNYGNGAPLAKTSFGTSTTDPNDLQGWQIVANGASPLRIDANGIFAVDDIIGEAEYNQKCDLAAPTGVCTYTCELGGGLTTPVGLDSTYNVLSLDGDDYTASMNGIAEFPSEALTVSIWVKTTQTDLGACLYSYAAPSTTAPAVPIALCNPSNLQFYINAESDASGLSTFVNVSDNEWHFLAVTWNSDDGRVRVYDNGMLAFDGGPYKEGETIESNGFFVAGHLVLSSSSMAPCTVSAEVLAQSSLPSSSSPIATAADVSCDVVAGGGFKGLIQHVHVWSRVLSRSELLGELAWPLRVVSNGLILGWNFDTSFLLLQGRVVNDLSMQAQDQNNLGVLHCTNQDAKTLQLASTPVGNAGVNSCLLHGEMPRLDATFPCGPVFANIWQFSAPTTFTSKLKNAYGGCLQFRLLAPSFNGSPRPRRGQVSIFGSTSGGVVTQISVALGSFDLPSASSWTYYSVVLREDFGWIREPDGASLTADQFKAVLNGATTLWIRGDIWGYDSSGPGQEVVYLNDVALYGR